MLHWRIALLNHDELKKLAHLGFSSRRSILRCRGRSRIDTRNAEPAPFPVDTRPTIAACNDSELKPKRRKDQKEIVFQFARIHTKQMRS